MKFGNQTKWDHNKETVDEWLVRENLATEKVENICCPYCERIDYEWYEYSGLQDWECSDVEVQCSRCSKKFLVEKQTSVRFECSKIGNLP